MNQKLQQLFPGFLLSVVVGSVVMLLSSWLQTSHSILLGLLVGILINNFWRSKLFLTLLMDTQTYAVHWMHCM